MSKNLPTDPDYNPEEWDDVRVGMGEELELSEGQSFRGYFLGMTTQDITDKATGEIRPTNAYQFSPVDAPDEVVFIWGSQQIDAAMNDEKMSVRQGDELRITFLGREQFTGKDGKPRQVKRYRIQIRKVAK